MPEYIAVLHAYIQAEDEITATLSAEDIKERVESTGIIETDEGEALDIIEVIPVDFDPTPTDRVLTLKRARNELIRTRTKDGWDLARELDKAAYALARQLSQEDALINYDWSKFLEVTQQVLNGENPL